MFWGLNLKPNRKYSQTSTRAFHISQAALDSTMCDDGLQQIFVTCETQTFLLCTLRKDKCEQVMLDLNFLEGDDICFHTIGNGTISLSGYIIDDGALGKFLNTSLGEESNSVKQKSKAKAKFNSKEEDEDDDDDDDDDYSDSDLNAELLAQAAELDDDSDEEDEDDDDEDEDEEDDYDEDDESEDEEVQEPKLKQPKLEKAQKKDQQNGTAKGKDQKKGKDKKQQPEKKQENKQQKQATGERVLAGGVKIEDIRVGNGPEAKNGKRAKVYYEGRLKSNNKVFDSLRTGAGFAFSLGRGEVIKGWDVGVAGMKVGGKRRITCPAHMSYGARGSPPTIPPNSTLVFEVELKSVN